MKVELKLYTQKHSINWPSPSIETITLSRTQLSRTQNDFIVIERGDVKFYVLRAELKKALKAL